MTRAAIYVRVSTEGQKDGASPDEQRRVLVGIAERHGWAFDVFDEVGSAGDGADGLPVLTDILGRVTMGVYQFLLAYHLDRLSRAGVGDGERIKSILSAAGCEIVTPGGKYDPRNESDDLNTDVQWLIAKADHRRIFNRLYYQGLEVYAKDGSRKMGHRVPFGYQEVFSPDGSRHIEIVPHEAAAIRRAYELFCSRAGGAHIVAGMLREEGFTGRGGRALPSVTVAYWLSNPRYAGQEFRRSPHTRWHAVKRKFSRETETVMTDSHVWPAIIDMETWAEAQEIQRGRTEERRRTPRSPLGGVLLCPRCGGRTDLVKHHSSKIVQYRCRGRGDLGPSCSGAYIRADEAHLAVYRWIKRYLNAEFPDFQARPEGPRLEERAGIEAALGDIKRAEDRLMDALLKGVLTDDQVARKNAELRTEREALIKRLNAVPRVVAPRAMPKIPPSAIDNIQPVAEDPLFRQLVRSLLSTVKLEAGPERIAQDRLGRKWRRKTYRVSEAHTVSGHVWLLR